MSDPWAILGISPSATADQAVAARRTLAATAHPDVGGSTAEMQRINAAYVEVIALIAARPRHAPSEHPSAPVAEPPTEPRPTYGGVQRDEPSFTIDALPAESFEALLVAASWIGEVLDDDPPYRLEVALNEPAPCWCRLDLVPDAGGSTVSLIVAPIERGGQAPLADDVRDTWVATLNQL